MSISIMVINKQVPFISKFGTFKNVMMLVFQFLSGIYIILENVLFSYQVQASDQFLVHFTLINFFEF
jgi:hypothetical protein